MKIFGKRASRQETHRRTLVPGRCYDDLALDAALAGLVDGDLRAAQTVLAECRTDAEVRDLRLTTLAKKLVGHAEEIAALATRGDEPELWLLAGAVHLHEAMAIRAGSRAGVGGGDRVTLVQEAGAKAVGPLHRVTELLPADATPWVTLMLAGLVLDAPREQRDMMWRETVARCPTHYTAHGIRLRTLGPRWGGSDEQLLAFAHDTVAGAPAGNPLTAVMPAAFFELYRIAAEATAGEATAGEATAGEATAAVRAQQERIEQRYFADEHTVTRLLAASERWLAEERPHPRALESHNLFAAAFGCAGHGERAFRHLVGTRDRFSAYPWEYLNGENPESVYHAMVARYWPADFRPPSPMDLSPLVPDARRGSAGTAEP